ncbi:MAG: helix-turn-helix transcriptional regulator [Candidatus Bathyarchaeia archaeon]
MQSKLLIFVALVALVVSFLGLFFFVFGANFGRGYGADDRVSRSLWFVLFVVPLIVASLTLGYALIFPELSVDGSKTKIVDLNVEKGESVFAAVLRVLDNDEKKVVEALAAEGGTMLQKDIRWKTGFSRVKTHRTLLRLAKRGIVSAEKYYNSKKIVLADWLKNNLA